MLLRGRGKGGDGARQYHSKGMHGHAGAIHYLGPYVCICPHPWAALARSLSLYTQFLPLKGRLIHINGSFAKAVFCRTGSLHETLCSLLSRQFIFCILFWLRQPRGSHYCID